MRSDGGVRVDLLEQQRLDLLFLVGWGYGDNEAEVARYLIQRALDDLRRARVIPPRCECSKPND